MENEEPKEPEKKKPHLNSHSLSSAMARNSATSPSSNKTVDAAVLQHQNQKLVQQLDAQKHEFHDLEAKVEELKENQSTYDGRLITVNRRWNQLIDDFVLLGARAGGGLNFLRNLDSEHKPRDLIPSCSPEEMFLSRLLQVNSIESSGSDDIVKFVEEALVSRQSSTTQLMKNLEDIIDAEREKCESIAQDLHANISTEDAFIFWSKFDDMMKEEAGNLSEVIDTLRLKHQEYANRIQTYICNHEVDQSEIQRLTGELEECLAELEDIGRKLVSLQMELDLAYGKHNVSPAISVNGSTSPVKPADRAMDLEELKELVEEAKILAGDRLSELEYAQQDNMNLSKQLQSLQNEINDDKYVHSSRLYNLVNDQLQHWRVQVERYKALAESLQVERSHVIRKEKELNVKAESANAARNSSNDSESIIEQLELQLQKCVVEKNDLEFKMEEAVQDSGRKDIKAEFHVMGSALSKEMGMMEAQVNRWKGKAEEALSLREQVRSLKASLSAKTNEQRRLAEKCDEQTAEIKSLKALIEKLQKGKQELQIILDMYGQEGYDNRDLTEIKESERRAQAQAEVLKNALDEHSLELRVKAANEAEAACQERLSAAEAEIAELRVKLDSSERDIFEVTEAIKTKELEAETYISEIETIGQAYDDMQTQNQRLLAQVAERDDYNIKLVSESVKAKHVHSMLLAETQASTKHLQQINASVESLKTKILQSEEQMKACLSEALKYTQEDRHLAISLETTKWELADAEKEFRWLKSSLSSSEKENEQLERKTEEVRRQLEMERAEKRKAAEELAEINRQIAELESETGEAAVQKLQDEINDCKAILKCGVCFDRPKEVVILKCFHLFCNPCIQRNFELRHRKCPGCGTTFGQNDVRHVKI